MSTASSPVCPEGVGNHPDNFANPPGRNLLLAHSLHKASVAVLDAIEVAIKSEDEARNTIIDAYEALCVAFRQVWFR